MVDSAVSGVQSISRVFGLLEAMTDLGGVAGVSELAPTVGLPLPTVHRLLRSLVSLGYLRQEPSREYALGPKLVRLGEAAGRLLGSWAEPHLRQLAQELGESANFALIDDTEVVYVAQAPGSHKMRMFTEVGHRADVHCTAVGKAILATYPEAKIEGILQRLKFVAHTSTTITTVDALMREIAVTRERGYGLDLGEQEIGVSCVAVSLPGSSTRGAVSISAPAGRLSEDMIAIAVPQLMRAAASLGHELDQSG